MTIEELKAFIDANLVSGPGLTQSLSKILHAIVDTLAPAEAPTEPSADSK